MSDESDPNPAPVGASPTEASPDAPHEEAVPESPDPPMSTPSGPGISSVRPNRAGATGGMSITVFGGGFAPGCKVRIDNVETETVFIDPFSIRFEAPAHPSGSALVEVENPDGQKSATAMALHYVPGPAIASVTPHDVPPEGGIDITVEGSGFEEGVTLNLFGVHAPACTRASDSVLIFRAPPRGEAPAEGTLVVTNPDGIATRYEDALFYRALEPHVDRVEPSHAWVSGGKAVSVYGRDFHAACAAELGGARAEVRFQSATHVDIVVPPAAAAGIVNLSILNPDGSSATLEGGFTYERVPAPPKLISITPDRGSTVGREIIRISGDNFTDTMRVRIGEVTSVAKLVGPKIVDVETPARSLPGLVAVELSDAGVTIRSEDAFTYVSPSAPKLVGIDPMTGPAGGGTRVMIDGEGFPKNATVRFGGEAAKHVVVKSTTQIETTTPPSKNAGTVDVEVTSPETGPGVMKSAFRYEATPAPTITSVAPTKGGTGGGTELTVEGKNFAVGVAVTVGKRPAKSVKRISGSILEVKTPEGDDGELADVTVKNPDGKQAVQKRAFQYDARYRG